MDSEFLNRLAKVLKTGKSAACQRAIERLLAKMKNRYEEGGFDSPSKAELAFRRMVDEETACKE